MWISISFKLCLFSLFNVPVSWVTIFVNKRLSSFFFYFISFFICFISPCFLYFINISIILISVSFKCCLFFLCINFIASFTIYLLKCFNNFIMNFFITCGCNTSISFNICSYCLFMIIIIFIPIFF